MEIITNLKMNVSVVIPVLNEKESLPELVRELEHSLSTYSAWEVLFIDDLIENIESAKTLGLNTIHYKNYNMLKKELHGLGIETLEST